MYATLSLNDSKFKAGLKAANASLQSFSKGAGKYAAAGSAITTALATGFVISSSKAAASLEDLSVQFEVLTGSASTSADLLKAFREEEKKSALSTQDYANAAKTFLAFGGSIENTLPSLKMLADVSMGNSERFGSLALAFAQTTAAGRLMGQEVLQFVNAGFNPLEQIARDTGKSMADLKKEMEDGKISVQMVTQAFANATSEGGRFYKAIDKGSATTSAKLNQLAAQITQLKVAFGTGFNEGLKDLLDNTGQLANLEGILTSIGNKMGEFASEWASILTDKSTWDLFVLRVELAFARISQLPVFKQFLTATEYIANGLDFKELGSVADGSNVRLIEMNIESMYEDIARQAEKDAIAKDAARRGSEPIPFVGPPAPVVVTDIQVPTPEATTPAITSTESPQRVVDDYMRRGLSMTTNPGSMQDKVLKVQEAIRDILKNAQIQDKQLVW